MKKRTIISFSLLFLFFAVFALAYSWAWRQPELEGVPAPFRTVLEWNGKIWAMLYHPTRLSEAPAPAPGKAPRVNGDIGLEEEIDLAHWKMQVDRGDGSAPFTVTMADLRALPRADTATNFKCIEGWSEEMSFAGVRFSDFLKFYGLGIRSGKNWGANPPLEELYPYVGLETPDGQYYVSIDMASMLHPQTLLAFEMNGQPLSQDNGAPLRLAIPVKYGIKNLKRIGKIFFSSRRPRDYWAEQGYDWFSGL